MPNWSEALNEINQLKVEINAQSPSDIVRRKYLKGLYEKTGRNVIAYYSGWLSKPNLEGIQITDEDKNAIMTAVHELDRSVGLDLVLHTPGGELPQLNQSWLPPQNVRERHSRHCSTNCHVGGHPYRPCKQRNFGNYIGNLTRAGRYFDFPYRNSRYCSLEIPAVLILDLMLSTSISLIFCITTARIAPGFVMEICEPF